MADPDGDLIAQAHQLDTAGQLADARRLLHEHNTAEQHDTYPDRCSRCGYSRHPCDTFNLAAWLITALTKDTAAAAADERARTLELIDTLRGDDTWTDETANVLDLLAHRIKDTDG